MPEQRTDKPAVPQRPLPEQGGLVWFAGGVPASSMPDPCVRCLHFLAESTDMDIADFIRRIRNQIGSRPGNTTSTPS